MDQSGQALGHSFSWTVVDPICTEDGSKTGVCDRCGHTWTGIIPALGCDWSEWTVVQDAADGQTGYRVRECRRCGSKELEYFDADGNILSLPEDKYSYDAVTVSMVEVSKAKYDQGYAAGDAVEVQDAEDIMPTAYTAFFRDRYQNEQLEPGKTLSYVFNYTLTETDYFSVHFYDTAYVLYETEG